MCKEGNSLLNSKSINETGSVEKTEGNVIVYGGFNGGGVSSMDIKTAIPHCGGGGGAKGGMSALNSFTIDINGNKHTIVPSVDNNITVDNRIKFHTPVTSGCGGSCYIDQSVNNNLVNQGDYNSGDGKVLLIKYDKYYKDRIPQQISTEVNHQLIGSNYIFSHHRGLIDNYRVLNKLSVNSNPQYDQLRIRILFHLNDVTTNHLNPTNVDNFIQIQPVFYIVEKNQILRFDLPNDNALLDTVRAKNIIQDLPFNEEYTVGKKEAILTSNLLKEPLETAGKLNIKSDTLEYTNFFNIKDSNLNLEPQDIYLVIQSPLKNINYDLLTIECNHEDMDKNDYLFNKILKRDN